MGGYINQARKTAGLHVQTLRLEPIDPHDFDGITGALHRDGACLVKNVTDEDDMTRIKEQLR